MKRRFRWLFFIAIPTMIGCSHTPTMPAPVQVLNSQQSVSHEQDDHYIVKPGDTLFAIGWLTGHDYQAIAKLNQLSAPYPIAPGQRLRLPGFEKPAVATSPSRVKAQVVKTKKPLTKNPIDPIQNEAYGEKVVNVSQQRKNTPGSFPTAVSQWVWPASGTVLRDFSSSEVGFKGLDIGAAEGAAVVSAAFGKVVYAGNALRGYGNLVIIKHTDAMLSAYAHLQTIKVKEQQWMQAGEVIGTVGSTGTESPKLHFEIRYRGKSVDPLNYLPKHQK